MKLIFKQLLTKEFSQKSTDASEACNLAVNSVTSASVKILIMPIMIGM